ncbi:uncharacterized protein TRUGW13939_09740 [Talaromyces rugulosus]|uniref:Carrier domain-containing protein n=1 Tax=Talaromyces rugulosus TaxID=121627 RepID=A0A7H8R864_TALRU|nr:uncharacterized protein TRUGW13939_09740 [Talaromyces rugulosus]QKX62579.1 hypothetical protein TRUGW13939_09740 [Talaromyces rugulosus]
MEPIHITPRTGSLKEPEDLPHGEHSAENIKTVSDHDLHDIWKWNAHVPEIMNGCMHELIAQRVQEDPDAPAICAWDGDLTYSQLDKLSTRLAEHLKGLGIRPREIVPLYFEKSMWTPLAMLAVMKMGAASVILNAALPTARVQNIIAQVNAKLILTSQSQFHLACEATDIPALIVSESALSNLPHLYDVPQLLPVDPSSPLYVVFTSGSTGHPKGAVITHANFCSAVHHQQHALGFSKTARVFDFTSYAFDVAWSNVLHTWAAGGCLCIPSEADRLGDIVGSIRRLRANFLHLTPTVARILDPSALSSLEHVLFIGEPLRHTDTVRWKGRPHIYNTYGPAECTVTSTIEPISPNETNDPSIGRALGGVAWIVQPDNPDRLTPVGLIGELWLEGPIVGAGYFGDYEKTAASFIENPSWLLQGAPGIPGRRGRLYRTGDLVRYNANGSLIFVGRTDTQVKIHGQRIELGEIEYHVRQLLSIQYVQHVVAEIISSHSTGRQKLAVFFTILDAKGNEDAQQKARPFIAELEKELPRRLPLYMIPSTYIPIAQLPMTASGKTDRKILRELGAIMSRKSILKPNSDVPDKHLLLTSTTERKMQLLWASIFLIRPDEISAMDSFLRLGGDSISAMRLTVLARQQGLAISVGDILQHPQLSDLAKVIENRQVLLEEKVIQPFSLLGESVNNDEIQQQAADLCAVNISQVEDVFPCTPLQEGLLAMTAKSPDDYILHITVELQPEVNIEQFQAAWEEVISIAPVLRSCITHLPGHGLVQVVLRKPVKWKKQSSLEETTSNGLENPHSIGVGQDLAQFGITVDAVNNKRYFNLLLHHAVYDGWSLPLLQEVAEKIYKGEPYEPLVPMQPFIRYLHNCDTETQNEFWKEQFLGLEATQFPVLPAASYQPRADQMIDHVIEHVNWPAGDVTLSTVIRAAWAIVLSWYAGSPDAVFGVVVLGRQVPVHGIERIAGPTIATVPLRVTVDRESTVQDLLQRVHRQAAEMIPFEHTGLQYIRGISEDAASACRFQTLLVIQPASLHGNLAKQSCIFKKPLNNADFRSGRNGILKNIGSDASTYAISVSCNIQESGLCLQVHFDSNVISVVQAKRIAIQLEYLLRQLCSPDVASMKVRNVQKIDDHDLNDIWSWNSNVPETIDACVHDLIAKNVQDKALEPAVCAWDGDLTYSQLDILSTRLALSFMVAGIEPHMTVPLLFEKSMWTPIAMLAVMKIGACSALLDVSQPLDRLKYIIGNIDSAHIICGASVASLALSIGDRKVFIVERERLSVTDPDDTPSILEPKLPRVSPSDLLYVVFTSGSTGKPKGVMITHSNATSAVKHWGIFGISPTSRVADFASYAFDVAWYNFLNPLIEGGCICIPSEKERKHDLVNFMIRTRVNHITLTPSVASVLDLQLVSGLQTIILGGELVDFDKLKHLMKIKNIVVAYGPAECTINTTAVNVKACQVPKGSIGLGCGATTWVLDLFKDTLVPIGAIGELALEGPLIGKGYMGGADRIASAFIESPPWMLSGAAGIPGRVGRIYRTGDLVRYHTDGTLIFVGRKDNQVKIRGQRLELGEIESNIRDLIPSNDMKNVIAEVINPPPGSKKVIAAFFTVSSTSRDEKLENEASPIISKLEMELPQRLPAYMIPDVYIPITDIPMTATGKVHRRALRNIGALMYQSAVSRGNESSARTNIEPSTVVEVKLRELWKEILNIDEDGISTHHSFLRLGGDSISAMRLTVLARQQGLAISVGDILQHPQLSDLAKVIENRQVLLEEKVIQPFSLLGESVNNDEIQQQAADLCAVNISQVEDVFPCTPLQEGLLAMTAKSPDDYILHITVELQPEVNIEQFQAAWEEVISIAPVLRSCITHLPGHGLVQVVLRKPVKWKKQSSLEETTSNGLENPHSIGVGQDLAQFGITVDAVNNKRYFNLLLHHAVYDGWSLPLLQEVAEKIYKGEPYEPLVPMQPFIRYLHNCDTETQNEFWKEQFLGLEATQFPVLPAASYQPRADQMIDHVIEHVNWPAGDVTLSTVIRAAWAIVLSWYAGSPDAVFGVVVLGRQVPVHGIERIAGPTIATVPLRVTVDRESTVQDLLQRVHRQAAEMIPFEHTGLQYIRGISEDAASACRFQTLLIVQPPTVQSDNSDNGPLFKNDLYDKELTSGNTMTQMFDTYAINLNASVRRSSLLLQLRFDSTIISEQDIKRMMQRLEQVINQITQPDQTATMQDIKTVSDHDLHDIWKWNAHVPEIMNGCMHELIAQRVQEDPDAPAICAWDGDLTYSQLDKLSTRLAEHLKGLGIRPREIVPLYFEKSMWTPLAMLAVMKMGAASVILNAALPTARVQNIIAQVNAKLILTSQSQFHLACEATDIPALIVSESALSNLPHLYDVPQLLPVDPSSPLYVVFTSGSTGHPKGAVITHANFCSAVHHQQHALGFSKTARVFDFTSYAFDVAWSNVLHTWAAGGCLCIPSEADRLGDIVGSIRRLRANFLHLTPTVARILDPSALSSLEHVLFIGEPLRHTDTVRWKGRPHIYNTYGPAECTVTSTIEPISPNETNDPSIGRALGGVAWIVQPDNPDRLTPVGLIGELWLEGPIVGAGYFGDYEKTAASFIENPSWLLQGAPGIPGRRGRLYRTGDLVRYNANGSLIFVGRTDTQVKIHGQRIELGEIEYHVRQLLSIQYVQHVVAEIISSHSTGRQKLAVFFTILDAKGNEDAQQKARPFIAELEKELPRRLPLYMIPSTYIPIAQLPMTASGKTDRKVLRHIGALYDSQYVETPLSLDSPPTTETELRLSNLCASILNIDYATIDFRKSFPDIGGDSITIMSLAIAIQTQWNLKIPITILAEPGNSLRDLSFLIDNFQEGHLTHKKSALDIDREMRALSDKLFSPSGNVLCAAQRTTVFVTGSTGYLGTQILRSLLVNRTFDRVVLLVRPMDNQGGLERVKKSAELAGWWDDMFASTIDVWQGDLSKEKFDLTDSQWLSLSGSQTADGPINAIIHNGAVVHWTSSYDKLKKVNVESTLQLLRVALASPCMNRFIYISGGEISANRDAILSNSETNQMTGYDLTKYISERLVGAVVSKYPNSRCKFMTIKPALIIGDASAGIANPDDFLWRLVITTVRLKARPIETRRSWLAISDARHISEIILQQMTASNTEYRIEIKRGIWLDNFWSAIEDHLRVDLRPLAWKDWVELAKEEMALERELHPLWPVQQFLGDLGTVLQDHDESFARDGDMLEIELAVRRNLEYLKDIGLLHIQDSNHGQLRGGRDLMKTRRCG